MKSIKILGGVMILVGILLSACAPSASPAAPANVGGGKSLSDVTFTGVIESMTGDQWTINGQMIKVDQSILQDGPYMVGDRVTVEAVVDANGSVTAQRVEIPSAADLAASSTPDSSSTAPQGPVFDDSGTGAVGTVDSITETSVTINGQTFIFAAGVEIKGDILPGALVKLHFIVNADGSLSVREIEFADPTLAGNDNNSNDSNVNDDNSNDDNGNDSNSNDDNGNDDNSNNDQNDSNDDNGGNSNDDGGSDDNSGGGNDNG